MIRFWLALFVGKGILLIIKTLNLSGGKAAPGYYALKIDPNLVKNLAKSIPLSVMVTGTNGKTTTCRIIHHLLKPHYSRILRNGTGSNLERGVASELLKASSWVGRVETDLALWEVDEAAFNHLLPKLQPDYLVIMNALRDQLDRYGEVDTVVQKWHRSLEMVAKKPLIIFNGVDPNLESLASLKEIKQIPFVFADHQLKWEGTKVRSTHAGYQAEIKSKHGLGGNTVKIAYQDKVWQFDLNLVGEYQVYNLTAALAVVDQLRVILAATETVKLDIQPAFGRMEKVFINGIESFICLIKNPAGATTVLETIEQQLTSKDQMVILLNDNFADGTDISWIWDVDFEILASKKNVNYWCGGTRGVEMELRLKYAGIDPVNIHRLAPEELMPKLTGGRAFILPTYTALLGLQKELTKMGIKNKNWQEE